MQVRTNHYSFSCQAGLLAILLTLLPLAARTVRITVTPSDSSALIADLQPLFGLPWQLAATPEAAAHFDCESSFIDQGRGFLLPLYTEIQPVYELWHYEAGRWRRENLGTYLDRAAYSLFALSPRDIWLSFHPGRTLKQDLLHFDGRGWRQVPTPNTDRIRTIYMLSPTSGWAGCEWGQIMHYDGREWRLVPSPTEAHVLFMVMTSDSSGFAWTKTHRKENAPLIYNGREWRRAPGDSTGLLQLLAAVPAINHGTSLWPIGILTHFNRLQRSAAIVDTLLLEAPLAPKRLLFCHRSGTLSSGHLARSATSSGGGWIAHLTEKEEQDSSHVWQTISFFTLAGDKRSLVIRLPLQRHSPALFQTTHLTSSWYVAEHGLAIADFNGDDTEDIYAVATGAANHLYLLNLLQGGQMETESAAAAGLAGVAVLPTGIVNYDEGASAADVDNDGDQDILVTSLYGHNLLYRQIRRGRYREESEFAGIDNCLARTCSAVWADANSDGAIDLYLSNEDSTNRLYLNNGAGIFRDVTREAGLLIRRGGGGSAFGDIDDDGDPDLFVPRYGLANLLFRNEGAPRPGAVPLFRECGQEAGVAGIDTLARSTSASWGDVDNDGDLDLFVTNLVHSNQLLLNDGRGRFEETTAARGVASRDLSQTALLFDADNDGDLDLLTGSRALNRFHANKGKGYFYEATEEAGITRLTNAGGMAAFDLGEDGDLDVYLGQGEQHSALYDNRSNNRHWLEVKLRGDRGNRDAIGARLWLYRDGHLGEPAHLLGMREINGGSGYNSMNSRIAHFGLPDDGRFALRVRFPGGRIREITGISGGRLLELQESEGWSRQRALFAKWAKRLRANPEPRLPLTLIALFSFLLILFEFYLLRYKKWPVHTVWLMVLLPALLLLLLLIVLVAMPVWLRYGLSLALPAIAWALAFGLYTSRQDTNDHAIADLEKLYLAVSAFFHGEWASRKLNRIEFFVQNLEEGREPAPEVAEAIAGAINEYFTMIVPELRRILELASGSRIPKSLHTSLEVAMLNLTTALTELKVELHLGKSAARQNALRCSQILQMEMQSLRKEVGRHFSCRVDQLLEESLRQNRRPGVDYHLTCTTSEPLWARIPGAALSQILENLLDNAHAAISASPNKEITIALEGNADQIRIRVSDSGPGVRTDIAERLFHERVSSKSSPGGFGLYHAREVLTKFAGTVRLLEQEEGTGARFEITLKRIEHE